MNESFLNKVEKARERLESMNNDEFKKLLDENSVKADNEYDCDFTQVIECDYCKESAFNTIIEKNIEVLAENIFGKIHVWDKPNFDDMSVVFEIRCGSGYIRLGDRSEMGCIDHEDKFKVKYCPMCGRELK